jgi:hypothetical protein
MRPSRPPAETEEQKQQRVQAEQDNVRSIQQTAQRRTSIYRRLMSPRVSLATGARTSSMGII